MYNVTQGIFRTPRGQTATLFYREDTNDWNTIRSCMDEDEYRLADLHLEGTALDIGAYLGGVSIALALDNPGLQVIAVEVVPPNAELTRRNVEAAGVADRVTVVEYAAGNGEPVVVNWGYTGSEIADHHAFVGNAVWKDSDLHATHSDAVPTVTLGTLVHNYGPFAFAKVDCEGCEFPFLQGPGLKDVAHIRGEVHSDPADLVSQLILTHEVTMPSVLPGAFEAVRRA